MLGYKLRRRLPQMDEKSLDLQVMDQYRGNGFIPYRKFIRGEKHLTRIDSMYFTDQEMDEVLCILFCIEESYGDKFRKGDILRRGVPDFSFDSEDFLVIEESRERKNMNIIYLRLNMGDMGDMDDTDVK